MSVPKDGSTNILRPVSKADWIATGLRVPRFSVRTDGAGPNLIDDVVGFQWTAQGSPAMQQSIEAGYAAKAIGLTDGVAGQGFSVPAGRCWNELTQAVMVYLRFQMTANPAAAVVRTLFTWVGTNSCHAGFILSTNTKARIAGTGTPTGLATGTINYNDGHLHGLVLTTIPSSPILDHTTGTFNWRSDKEDLNANFPFAPDFQKGIGAAGQAALAPPPVLISDWAIWTGTDAEFLFGTTTPKGVLQALGWTVTP